MFSSIYIYVERERPHVPLTCINHFSSGLQVENRTAGSFQMVSAVHQTPWAKWQEWSRTKTKSKKKYDWNLRLVVLCTQTLPESAKWFAQWVYLLSVGLCTLAMPQEFACVSLDKHWSIYSGKPEVSKPNVQATDTKLERMLRSWQNLLYPLAIKHGNGKSHMNRGLK